MALLVASTAHTTEAPKLPNLGERLEQARDRIAARCGAMRERIYTGAEAAPAREIQTQIDCHGMEIYGAPRQVELMFNDGVLSFFWVLIELDELPALKARLTREHGPVIYAGAGYRVLASGRIALRTDPPEVLIALPAMMCDISGYCPMTPGTQDLDHAR